MAKKWNIVVADGEDVWTVTLLKYGKEVEEFFFVKNNIFFVPAFREEALLKSCVRKYQRKNS